MDSVSQPIFRRFSECLRKRGVGVDDAGQVSGSAAGNDCDHRFMNHVRRVRANNVHTEKLACFSFGDDFYKS